MEPRKHENVPAEPIDWGAEPFSWLRKRNQRRDRIAQMMQDSKPAHASHATPAQREDDRRHER